MTDAVEREMVDQVEAEADSLGKMSSGCTILNECEGDKEVSSVKEKRTDGVSERRRCQRHSSKGSDVREICRGRHYDQIL